MPSFELLPKIRTIYKDPDYPKHKPNTVYAEYTVAMHAKYDVLKKMSIENSFKTPFIAWVDIGYFREITSCSNAGQFELMPPSDFDRSAVAFTQVGTDEVLTEDVSDILKNNLVWVGGGMMIAKPDVMIQFATDYTVFVRRLLKLGLSNTDQQVIASMYSNTMKSERHIKVQTYKCSQDEWFCLGYTARNKGLSIQRRQGETIYPPTQMIYNIEDT